MLIHFPNSDPIYGCGLFYGTAASVSYNFSLLWIFLPILMCFGWWRAVFYTSLRSTHSSPKTKVHYLAPAIRLPAAQRVPLNCFPLWGQTDSNSFTSCMGFSCYDCYSCPCVALLSGDYSLIRVNETFEMIQLAYKLRCTLKLVHLWNRRRGRKRLSDTVLNRPWHWGATTIVRITLQSIYGRLALYLSSLWEKRTLYAKRVQREEGSSSESLQSHTYRKKWTYNKKSVRVLARWQAPKESEFLLSVRNRKKFKKLTIFTISSIFSWFVSWQRGSVVIAGGAC